MEVGPSENHRLAHKYYWPKMRHDVAEHVRRCKVCGETKPLQTAPAGFMGGHSKIGKPWDVICMDLVGPLPRSSHYAQQLHLRYWSM